MDEEGIGGCPPALDADRRADLPPMRRIVGATVTAQARLRDVLTYRDVRILCVLFLAAQLLDTLTTFLALGTHRFEEANPWFAGALVSHPLPAYAVKMGVAVGIMVTLLLLRIRWRLRVAVLSVFVVASVVAPAANLLRLLGA